MWYTVIFDQCEGAQDALDILETDGDEGAIQHLAQWDNGVETAEASDFNGHTYHDPQRYDGERVVYSDNKEYRLHYHLGLGYVCLYAKDHR